MRRVLTVLVSAVVGLGGIGLTAVPADAATGVTIKAIPDSQTPYRGTTTVKASYSTSGSVKISETAVTVTQGETTIAKSVPSVKLKAGTYTVGQRVTYRVKRSNGSYGPATNVRATQTLTLTDGPQNCATRADYDSVQTIFGENQESRTGDMSPVVSQKLFSSGSRILDNYTLGEVRDYIESDDTSTAEDKEQIAFLIDRYTEDGTYIAKKYRLCNTSRVAVVDFADSEAISIVIESPDDL